MVTLPPARAVHVACLCAAWCRLCEGYAAVFRQVVQAMAVHQPGLQAHWIDIEDEAELLGDLDIETFPTLVVVDADGAVRFAGALTPEPSTLQRVLAATLEGPAPRQAAAAEVQAFAQRLRQRGA